MPYYIEIAYQNPLGVFSAFHHLTGSILLDSAMSSATNRYSFIAIDPWQIMSLKNGLISLNQQVIKGCPWQILKKELESYSLPLHEHLPPFQGGVAGYFGYELAHHLEFFPYPAEDDREFPDLILGFYDVIIAFDHDQEKAWIVSSGFPHQGKDQHDHAVARAQGLKDRLPDQPFLYPQELSCVITCSVDQITYEQKVAKIIDHIYAGDIYQANLSRRFEATLPLEVTSFDLYQQLRKRNPAPFAAYLNFGDVHIASASPERFIKCHNQAVETKPIKGTAARSQDPQEDQKRALDLLKSEKDRAENRMIVDLLRNDLSRVCLPHTVKTPKLLELESFSTVHHLVSTVTGTLRPELVAIDLLKATFPGGSITGVPKIKAMEIISELEPTYRGPYCGSIGYIGFDGSMDTNIIIRTFCLKNNQITFQAGGGIVADSIPTDEYHETTIKAKALCESLGF